MLEGLDPFQMFRLHRYCSFCWVLYQAALAVPLNQYSLLSLICSEMRTYIDWFLLKAEKPRTVTYLVWTSVPPQKDQPIELQIEAQEVRLLVQPETSLETMNYCFAILSVRKCRRSTLCMAKIQCKLKETWATTDQYLASARQISWSMLKITQACQIADVSQLQKWFLLTIDCSLQSCKLFDSSTCLSFGSKSLGRFTAFEVDSYCWVLWQE